ncbi:MAG: thymidylate synthase [Elusimicrobia bacterium]|nr:thymidylate synthase [Elusimicrobiota bacterium]
MNTDGNIPVFLVEGETLPEVWEKAVVKTWKEGIQIKTEYDRPGDPLSKDCTMIMVCHNPLKEPRIHRCFPAGLDTLEIYRQEVVNGVHDHWINPAEGKWTYTYHERIFAYKTENKIINQIDYIIDKLSKTFYTRRAQAITWNVATDPQTYDPPCLQRLWFRVVENEKNEPVLNMDTHWRSRDGYKAAFMNIFALTDLQKLVAEGISKKIKKEVLIGRYTDMADSFHIYGSYYNEFKGFLDTVEKRRFEERTWNSEFAEDIFAEAREKLKQEKK